jgi:hypothetical protein
MNAYELAQELEWLQDEYYYIKESADMLRQQAEKISNMEAWEKKYLDRIEELEKEKIRAYDNGYEDGQKSYTQSSTQLHPIENDK